MLENFPLISFKRINSSLRRPRKACVKKWASRFIQILFIHERHREGERGRDTGRERSGLHAESLMWDSIQVLQDHALGCRRRYTTAPPGLPPARIFNVIIRACN